ncbi:MAG: flagellar biosynthesis protein FliQ [Anaerolineae bacterium]|nr:flagellar biosynthesis protein FliQ [Anaerolineae bacterium]
MDQGYLMSFAMNAITMTLLLVTPFLLVSLVIGSLISLFQAATQVNEITLTFVPKIAATILVLIILGGWMLQQIVTYTTNIFVNLPNLVK